MNRQLVIALLGLMICALPGLLKAQNKAITWSTFSGGFNLSTSATRQVKSQAGTVVGTAEGSTIMLASGFLAGLLPEGIASVEDITGLPGAFALKQNYPNPFNPHTVLTVELPEASDVLLTIYDLRGREVRRLVSNRLDPGFHRFVWDGTSTVGRPAPAGVYITHLIAGNFSKSVKMVLLR